MARIKQLEVSRTDWSGQGAMTAKDLWELLEVTTVANAAGQ
jgi:hypothetical protein